jgi:shikimate kinase
VNTSTSQPTHIVLIGMMGVGKSTVGRRLAKQLDRPFLDSDDEVVRRTGREVAEIFTVDGEDAFRDIEASVMLDLLASQSPSVIAAAGGSILRSETRETMKRAATVIWMRAPVDVLVGRTSRGMHRPALANDPVGTLTKMESDRQSIYAEVADAVVDCTQPISGVIDSILTAVEEVRTS